MAPKGYAIHMMEPGEVPTLLALHESAREIEPPAVATSGDPAFALNEFTRFLLAHEVFVAREKKTGERLGFAAAAAEHDLYWIARLAVRPDVAGIGLDGALLRAVAERAHWFFYRALGVPVAGAASRSASFYQNHGFIRIPQTDLPAWLDTKRRRVADGDDPDDRIVMLKWL
ncbi:GNAT family N-acetyltransferase [Fulvimarina sp. 2208YS6-2-32]|uniref:GNAT family N-acetyltransferase n=1 Tax=Fulvimarina uroteuthidis TaxID=3098149 RepID=A0ABU5HZN7_9HYPH|nr:GNAT family N-acetyltransferase [Fulvimarina sp. 2208YS6-2-32]MDY8108431.1 GNAT family N-acetyltransferase [Fulvimarina sp. 2208YS6-2-32]